MKKILAFIICIVLVCAMPLVTFAEDEVSDPVGDGSSVTENLPAEDETVTEGENEGEEVAPEPTPEPDITPEPEPEPEPTPTPTPEPTPGNPPETEEIFVLTTDMIINWVTGHWEEISVVVTLILNAILYLRKHAALNTSVGTMNNNSIKIAKESQEAVETALATVQGFKEEITNLLAEVRANEEEKQKLQETLNESNALLKSAKLANKELADEVAELLVLANIPNSKKDELYARHLKAVAAIADAEKMEVREDVEVRQ